MLVRFLRDFVIVDRPYPQVASAVRRDNGAWLRPLAVVAHREGESLRVRVGPGDRGLLVKEFDLLLGPIQETTDGLLVATLWQATGVPALFPTMEADLSISRLGELQTYLSLDGRYRRPLGVVGEHVDDLLLHRIAERSIRAFLQGVALELEDRVVGDAPPEHR
jgi:hypothetical protein